MFGGGRSVSPKAHDGALLMTEDANGTMWRIAYTGFPPVLSASFVEEAGQKYLTASITRSVPSPDITVEVSSDLHTWTSGPAATVTLTDTPAQLVVRDNTPYQEATARYIRLRP